MIRRLREVDNQGGFVIVLFGVCLVMLLAFASFCIDFGNVYVQIDHTQRTADAAALDGAPFLPDDPASAKAAALRAIQANGIDPGLVVFNGPDPNAPSYMKVTLRNTTHTILANLVGFKAFDYERSARAAQRPGLGLGSPFNVLGYEPAAAGASWQNGVGPPIQYFLTQNPGGNPKMNMDRWSAVNCSGGEDGCSGSTNDEYDAQPRMFNIEVDAGMTGTLAIEAYDPELDVLDSGPPVDTHISIWAPGKNPASDAPISTGGCTPQIYPALSAAVKDQWARLCTLTLDGVTYPSGRYQLGVSMPSSQNTEGQNDYSLRAAFLTGGAVDPVASTHVRVYADKELATHHEPSALLNYYLAKIPSSYAGQTIDLELYDLGETGAQTETIKFLDTGVEPTGCKLTVASQGINLAPTNGKCTFDVAPYYLKFDGHTQVVSIPIDPSYSCTTTQLTSCWLYLSSQSGGIADEGSSTSLQNGASPLRLYPNS